MRASLLTLLVLIGTACTPRVALPDRLATAHAVADDLFAGRYAAVVARMSATTKKALTETKLAQVMEPIREANPSAAPEVTTVRASKEEIVLDAHLPFGSYALTVDVDGEGAVTGLFIKKSIDASLAKNDGYESAVKLRPPFRGAWTAFNASRTIKNGHFSIASQRWAVDWVKTDARGQTFKTDGMSNTDYFAYGEPVLAPADATVTTVVDGIAENPAHTAGDTYFVSGNTIVLALAEHEYALLCHLIPGSLAVHRGQRVHAGDVIARVGNSGNSTEPHLHFQLMDKPRQIEAAALPAKFSDVWVNGKRVPFAWPDEREVMSDSP